MIRTPTRRLALALLAGTCLAPGAAAAPAALDRVPTDAPIVVGISNLGELASRFETLARLFPEQIDGMQPVMQMLDMPGLNRDGSAALAIFPPAQPDPDDWEAANDGEIYAIVPVDDFNSFVTELGGTPGDVAELNIMGEPAFAKDLGGGYAVLSGFADRLAAFEGQAGRLDAHKARLGRSGQITADHAHLVVVADIPTLAPAIEQTLGQMMQQAAMFGAMGGQDIGGQLELARTVATNYLRDAQSSVLGVRVDEDGVSIDLTAQFSEGSELAGFFDAVGNSSGLLGRLPAMDYFVAFASDFSGAGLRRLVGNMVEMTDHGDHGALPGFGPNLAGMFEHMNGTATVIGTTPALMAGGLLNNAVSITATTDADRLREESSKFYERLNNTSAGGFVYQSQYQRGAIEVAGRKVDAYQMRMQPDPDAQGDFDAVQMQQQAAMLQQGLFGMAGGPRGYIAAADGTLVQTFSRDQGLLTRAIEAAEAGNGLSRVADVTSVSRRLPEGRSAEAYINVASIIENVGPILAMFGVPLEAPDAEPMPPIAFGARTADGGVIARVFVPSGLLKLGAAFAEMEQQDPWAPPPQRRDDPEF